MNNLNPFNVCYPNYYVNAHQLSSPAQIVPELLSYSSNNMITSNSQISTSSANNTNPPPHKEKFKQIVPRRKFTPEEDKKIKLLVEKLGTESWDMIAEYMPDRSARQCRDRYRNYLLDYLCQEPWTCEEDQIIMSKFSKIGAHWVQIAKLLGRRSGNDVKNRWYKHLSKKYNQSMQEQHQVMTKLENEESQKGQIQTFQSNDNFLFTSPHCQINQSLKVVPNTIDNQNEICNKKDQNLQIQNQNLNSNADIKIKNYPLSNQSKIFSNENNSKLFGNNINLNHDAHLKNIECMNIFSNFEQELAFDQADLTSYIDNFFF